MSFVGGGGLLSEPMWVAVNGDFAIRSVSFPPSLLVSKVKTNFLNRGLKDWAGGVGTVSSKHPTS